MPSVLIHINIVKIKKNISTPHFFITAMVVVVIDAGS